VRFSYSDPVVAQGAADDIVQAVLRAQRTAETSPFVEIVRDPDLVRDPALPDRALIVGIGLAIGLVTGGGVVGRAPASAAVDVRHGGRRVGRRAAGALRGLPGARPFHRHVGHSDSPDLSVKDELLSRSRLEAVALNVNLYPELRRSGSWDDMLARFRRDLTVTKLPSVPGGPAPTVCSSPTPATGTTPKQGSGA